MTWDKELLARGYDLANPRLLSDVIGPEVAEAAAPAFVLVDQARAAIGEVYQRLASALPDELSTVGNTVGAVVGVVVAAKGILEQASKRWQEESTRHELEARDFLFAQRKDTEWRTRYSIAGPKAQDLDLRDSPGGKKGKDFLAQYKPPGAIFMRVGLLRDFVVSTYPTYASETQAGHISDGGLLPERVAQGVPERPGLLDRRAAIPPMPEKFGWNYLCDKPGPKADESSVIERVISSQECAPVPGSELSFSWGTFPFIGSNGEPWPLGPEGIAACLAMQAITPVWALIRESDVETCYRYWLKSSRLRELPRSVSRQLEPYEMVLDKNFLPYAQTDYAITKFQHLLPVPLVWPKRWAAIEIAFRRFFAFREMALRQPQLLPAALAPVIAANPDFKRKPRAGYSWADPLGDGWLDGGSGPKVKGYGANVGLGKAGPSPAEEEAARQALARRRVIVGGGLVAATAGAVAGVLAWRKRRG